MGLDGCFTGSELCYTVIGGFIPFIGRGRKPALGREMLPLPLRLITADTALGSSPGKEQSVPCIPGTLSKNIQ